MILARILNKHRGPIIDEWVQQLKGGTSQRYCQRPVEELYITVTRANDAAYAVLVNNDYSKIDSHIEWITRIRLELGFSLSEVQTAYELYRTILVPILVRELHGQELLQVLERVNDCLFYTITRFSNYFQSQHEKEIREYTQVLEERVIRRTRELSESEAKYRMLVEEINDGYFVNQDGIIVFANQAFCDMHGYTPLEILRIRYTQLIAPESLAYVEKIYEGRMKGIQTEELYTYFRRHKNGSHLATENKVKLITFEGEKAVAGICRDITERMEMERRVRESERFAHIGQLTTSLAHEIRNPLSAVKMNLQILWKNVMLRGNDKRRAEIIAKELGRLERILSEMLDTAKPVRLSLEEASIHEVINTCLDVLEVRLREKHVSVLTKYSKRVPFLLLDRDKIEQAVINVLLNSIEALTEGTIRIATKWSSRNGEAVTIEIDDNGPGIRPEDRAFVFDPFFSSKKKGTGLGLANVKKIVEAHGGSVRVASVRPHGTRLALSLPVR